MFKNKFNISNAASMVSIISLEGLGLVVAGNVSAQSTCMVNGLRVACAKIPVSQRTICLTNGVEIPCPPSVQKEGGIAWSGFWSMGSGIIMLLLIGTVAYYFLVKRRRGASKPIQNIPENRNT